MNFREYIEQYDDIVTNIQSDPMVYNVKTKKLGPGDYEVHTPKGVFKIEGGRIQMGRSIWHVTDPGEENASETFETLKQAKEYVQFVLNDRQGGFI
ncbi:MAG: hypothetical protein ACW987_16860 [Candidatus Thorarchaeota archaeon]